MQPLSLVSPVPDDQKALTFIRSSFYLTCSECLYALYRSQDVNVDKTIEVDFDRLKERATQLTGSAVLRTTKLLAAALFGQLAPFVFKRWGLTKDEDVLPHLCTVVTDGRADLSPDLPELLRPSYFSGRTLAEPVPFEECATYDWFIKLHPPFLQVFTM